jgi:hypothetical protein
VLSRKADVGRSAVPFVIDDPQLEAYLEELCAAVTNDVIANITFLKSVGTGRIAQDILDKSSRLGPAKLSLADRHLRELPQQFLRVLRLTDFGDEA